jgi:hypothetical protein
MANFRVPQAQRRDLGVPGTAEDKWKIDSAKFDPTRLDAQFGRCAWTEEPSFTKQYPSPFANDGLPI